MKILQVKEQHRYNINTIFVSKILGVLLMRTFENFTNKSVQEDTVLQESAKDFLNLAETNIVSLNILFHSKYIFETCMLYLNDCIVVFVRDKRLGNLMFEEYFEEVKE